MAKSWKPRNSNKTNLDELASLLKIDSFDDYLELAQDYLLAVRDQVLKEAKDSGKSDDQADALAEKAEKETCDYAYRKYYTDLVLLADEMFGKHGLILVPKADKKTKTPFEFFIVPENSSKDKTGGFDWNNAVIKIILTINGVGEFEFSSTKEFLHSGPWTPRQAVLAHLHWMVRWYDVYGEKAPKNRFSIRFD